MPDDSDTTARPLDLAVAVTTRDNRPTIERTLRSVRDLAAKIVVVDSGSTDGTIECCRELGAEVIHRDWDGPTIQKQFAIDQCRDHAWILLLDSDESLEDDLRRSVRRTIERNDPAFAGWRINRKIYYREGWLHHTFQPEWRLRLMRGTTGRVIGIGDGGRGGHDRVEVDGKVGDIPGVCRHDSWRDLTDICRRNLQLAQRAADFHPRGGTLLHILLSPPAAFLKQYALKRGFLDGWRGMVLAGAMASYTLQKHLFLAQRRAGRGGGGS